MNNNRMPNWRTARSNINYIERVSMPATSRLEWDEIITLCAGKLNDLFKYVQKSTGDERRLYEQHFERGLTKNLLGKYFNPKDIISLDNDREKMRFNWNEKRIDIGLVSQLQEQALLVPFWRLRNLYLKNNLDPETIDNFPFYKIVKSDPVLQVIKQADEIEIRKGMPSPSIIAIHELSNYLKDTLIEENKILPRPGFDFFLLNYGLKTHLWIEPPKKAIKEKTNKRKWMRIKTKKAKIREEERKRQEEIRKEKEMYRINRLSKMKIPSDELILYERREQDIIYNNYRQIVDDIKEIDKKIFQLCLLHSYSKNFNEELKYNILPGWIIEPYDPKMKVRGPIHTLYR